MYPRTVKKQNSCHIDNYRKSIKLDPKNLHRLPVHPVRNSYTWNVCNLMVQEVHPGLLHFPQLQGLAFHHYKIRSWPPSKETEQDDLFCTVGTGWHTPETPRQIRISVPQTETHCGYIDIPTWAGHESNNHNVPNSNIDSERGGRGEGCKRAGPKRSKIFLPINYFFYNKLWINIDMTVVFEDRFEYCSSICFWDLAVCVDIFSTIFQFKDMTHVVFYCCSCLCWSSRAGPRKSLSWRNVFICIQERLSFLSPSVRSLMGLDYPTISLSVTLQLMKYIFCMCAVDCTISNPKQALGISAKSFMVFWKISLLSLDTIVMKWDFSNLGNN